MYVCVRVLQKDKKNSNVKKGKKIWADSDYMGKINYKKNFKIFFFNV